MMPNPGANHSRAQGQQTNRRLGSLENPKKFNEQDFEYLREYHLRNGLLFEDDTFPAGDSSIGPKLISNLLSNDSRRVIQWKRPGEKQRDPHLLVDGASIFDIRQGELGDCWVLSVIGAMTIRPHFLENVIPTNQGFHHKYAGIFHFRFWQYGDWVDVVIDDKLPFVNGSYMSVQPRSNNEFWPSLLEKAYAKLRSSYQHLHWGFISEALVDFTGGAHNQFSLQNPAPDLGDIVLAAAKSGALAGCTTPGDQIVGNVEVENGLVKGHAYTVTCARQVPYKNRMEDLVQIWNPWGQGEWNGAWSDNSVEWESVRPDIRKELNVRRNDGQFWMSCKDFLKYFAQINICNLTPTYLDFEEQLHTWTKSGTCSRWVKGSTSGGCFNNGNLIPHQSNQQVPWCEIKSTAKLGSAQPIYKLITLEDEFQSQKGGLPQSFFNQNASEAIYTGLVRSREVTQTFKAPPGSYVIVPYTEHRGLESEFLLRVFQKSTGIAKELEMRLNVGTAKRLSLPELCCFASPQSSMHVGRSPLIVEEEATYRVASPNFYDGDSRKTTVKPSQQRSPESIFAQYARQGSEIDASQLQMLLNDMISHDQTFPAVEGGFTLDACRGILTLMDLNADGRLNMQEFERLWKRINMCKNIFNSNVHQSKSIDMSGLQNAVQEAGLSASSDMLSLLVLRYGDSAKRLSFTDFVSCILRLETVTKVFRNLTKDGKGIYLSGEEWMQIIMSS
ncbi:calpain-13-like [Lissotriton helveticus]